MGSHLCCQQNIVTSQYESYGTNHRKSPKIAYYLPIQPDKQGDSCNVTQQLEELDMFSPSDVYISYKDITEDQIIFQRTIEQKQNVRNNLVFLPTPSIQSPSPTPIENNQEPDDFDFQLDSQIEETKQFVTKTQKESTKFYLIIVCQIQIIKDNESEKIVKLEQNEKPNEDNQNTLIKVGLITLNNIESQIGTSPRNLQSLYEIDFSELNLLLSPKSAVDFQNNPDLIRRRNYSFDPNAHQKAVKECLQKYVKHKNPKSNNMKKSRFKKNFNDCLL